jgi:ATP-dependent Clp protease ATP-binding subunit ClpA
VINASGNLLVVLGVGKTAIAEGLAQRIASGDVPETIEGKKVITLDMGLLVAVGCCEHLEACPCSR